MTDENGIAPDFTHKLEPFVFEGITFRRRKVDAKEWADTLAEVGKRERVEIAKEEGSVLFGVSGDGLYKLVSLGIDKEDLPAWEKLYKENKIEFGELAALRDWLWEKITERPFTSGTPSSDGPGESNEASSKDESSSLAEVQQG